MDDEKSEATYEGAERQPGLRQDARTLGMAAQLKQQAATDMILTARAQAAVAQSANDLEAFVEDAQLVLDEVYMELEKQCDEAQARMATIREARELLSRSFGRSSTLVHERLGNAFTEISLDQMPPSLAIRQQEPASEPQKAPTPEAQAAPAVEDERQGEVAQEAAAAAAESEPKAEQSQSAVGAFMEQFGAEEEADGPDQAPTPGEISENEPASEEDAVAEATQDVPQAQAAFVPEAASDLDEPDGIAQEEEEDMQTTILPESERNQGLTMEQMLTTLVNSGANAATLRAYGLSENFADEIVRTRRR